MRIRRINITIEPKEEVLKRFAIALGKVRRGEHVTPEHGIGFENFDVFKKAFTRKRMELLHAIKEHKPESIYELAKCVDRDLKSVNTDLDALKEMGLVILESNDDERRKVKPVVGFDRIDVQIAV